MSRKRRGRGEGSIYQRDDGLWVGSVSVGYDGAGRRKRRVAYGTTKAEVQEKLRRLDTQAAVSDAGKLYVRDYLMRWLESVKPNIAPTTWVRYEQFVRLQIVPHVGGIRLSKMVPLHVEQLYVTLERSGASVSTRHKAGVVLQIAMQHAVHPAKLIAHNPCTDIPKPRPAEREMRAYDAGQVERLLKAAEADRLHALYVVAISTGMRQGELFGLEWADIDFGGRSLQVQRTLEEIKGKLRLKEPKSAKGRRRIDLPQFAIQALTEHRARMLTEGNIRGPVFCDQEGNHLRRPNVQRRSFLPIMSRAELPRIRFHDLRHTAATLLLLGGVHPKVVSERLGHAKIEFTLRVYSHVLPTMQKEAADKLDRMFG